MNQQQEKGRKGRLMTASSLCHSGRAEASCSPAAKATSHTCVMHLISLKQTPPGATTQPTDRWTDTGTKVHTRSRRKGKNIILQPQISDRWVWTGQATPGGKICSFLEQTEKRRKIYSLKRNRERSILTTLICI